MRETNQAGNSRQLCSHKDKRIVPRCTREFQVVRTSQHDRITYLQSSDECRQALCQSTMNCPREIFCGCVLALCTAYIIQKRQRNTTRYT